MLEKRTKTYNASKTRRKRSCAELTELVNMHTLYSCAYILWSAVFQQTSASAGVVKVLGSFYRSGEVNTFERHRSRIPVGQDQRNVTEAKKHMINFLGLSQLATSLGMGNFELKLYTLARNTHGKIENLHILTQQQWEMGVDN